MSAGQQMFSNCSSGQRLRLGMSRSSTLLEGWAINIMMDFEIYLMDYGMYSL